MKIAIVGWGLEAQSAYRHFGPDHEYLIVNESPQDNFPAQSDKIRVQYSSQPAPVGISGQVTDLSYLKGIEECDKIVFQPTAFFNLQKVYGDNVAFWAKATTAYDIFFENVPTKNIIGVTGTKGKGTTSSLIAEMLKATGRSVHIGGNIGTPILDILPQVQADDWLVWELANFQLKAAHHSPHIGVCLMITEEHLDWHPNMDDYIEAKANLFKYQKNDDIAVYFAENEYSSKIADSSPGVKVPYFKAPGARVRADGMIVIGEPEVEVISKTEVGLLGDHNLQNICAALTAVQEAIGSLDKAKAVLSSFTGLEHRLELVRTLDGVKYYDDSFGTTPDTAIVAIKAFTQPVVLIAGGSDKGVPFDEMAKVIANKGNVRHVITIGDTGPVIANLLRRNGYTTITEGIDNMQQIVAEAKKHAQAGDVVLLSTGCASFGLFKDYKDRGDQFKQAVQALV